MDGYFTPDLFTMNIAHGLCGLCKSRNSSNPIFKKLSSIKWFNFEGTVKACHNMPHGVGVNQIEFHTVCIGLAPGVNLARFWPKCLAHIQAKCCMCQNTPVARYNTIIGLRCMCQTPWLQHIKPHLPQFHTADAES